MTEAIAKLDRLGEPGMALADDLLAAGLTVVPMGWPQVAVIRGGG